MSWRADGAHRAAPPSPGSRPRCEIQRPSLGLEDVARAGRCWSGCLARGMMPGRLVHRRLGADQRVDRVEQRQVDHLPLPPSTSTSRSATIVAIGAVEPGDHVGERGRRQHRLAVGKAGLARRSPTCPRPACRSRAVCAYGPVCPQPETRTMTSRGLRACSTSGAEAHLLQRPGTVVLDQHVRARRPGRAAARWPRALAQVEREALLVARVGFQ